MPDPGAEHQIRAQPLSSEVTDVSNAADKRVVRVRIRLDDGEKVQGLVSSQVTVRIRG